MSGKPVVPRTLARADAEAAITYYLAEAGPDAALGFIDALEHAYGLIAEAPAAGSPRWAHELNLPGLRALRLKGYPWLVFCMERGDAVDVWRILHARRDIPAWMEESD